MKEIFVMLNNNMHNLFKQTSTWIGILLIMQILTFSLILYIYLEITDGQYHFYMNTKTSLEKIHKVKINKYNGDLLKELTTEEELIRRNARKWHLKYLFK